jgi:hypothetical protein
LLLTNAHYPGDWPLVPEMAWSEWPGIHGVDTVVHPQ